MRKKLKTQNVKKKKIQIVKTKKKTNIDKTKKKQKNQIVTKLKN